MRRTTPSIVWSQIRSIAWLQVSGSDRNETGSNHERITSDSEERTLPSSAQVAQSNFEFPCGSDIECPIEFGDFLYYYFFSILSFSFFFFFRYSFNLFSSPARHFRKSRSSHDFPEYPAFGEFRLRNFLEDLRKNRAFSPTLTTISTTISFDYFVYWSLISIRLIAGKLNDDSTSSWWVIDWTKACPSYRCRMLEQKNSIASHDSGLIVRFSWSSPTSRRNPEIILSCTRTWTEVNLMDRETVMIIEVSQRLTFGSRRADDISQCYPRALRFTKTNEGVGLMVPLARSNLRSYPWVAWKRLRRVQ